MPSYFASAASKVLLVICVVILATFTWNYTTSKRAHSSEANSAPSSEVSPFVVDTSKRPWCRTKNCPRSGEPEFISLHWRYAKARWEKWTEDVDHDNIKIHGASIRASSITAFEMTAGRSIELLSNIRNSTNLEYFRPASQITLASCLWPADMFPENGTYPLTCRRLPDNLLRVYPEGFGPCLYAQDYFAPEYFQHALINSVPTNYIASMIRRFLLPNALLVGKDATQAKLSHEEWQKWDKTQCGKEFDNDTLREWIFIGTGEPSHASHDCYPVGTFDRFRDNVARHTSHVINRNLIVFASRDDGTGSGSRMPRSQDTAALEKWLSGDLAPELRLAYVKLLYNAHPQEMRRTFERARVIFAPHGGALSNLVYCHVSTIVVEFQPAYGMRLCFACMAYAMRFPVYAVYVPEGSGGWLKDMNTKMPYNLYVPDLKKFWYNKLEAEFRTAHGKIQQ